MDYEKDTRLAYKDRQKAKAYRTLQTTDKSWGRFASWREKACVKKALSKCSLAKDEYILDIPCGTGVLASVLRGFPGLIVAGDISREMMELAWHDFQLPNFLGFIQADITQGPFRKETFSCIITLGLMHRVPENVRKDILEEISSLSKKFIIISYSLDSVTQRIKHWLIKKIIKSHKPAPSPLLFNNIMEEISPFGLMLRGIYYPMPFFSSEIVFLLEKKGHLHWPQS